MSMMRCADCSELVDTDEDLNGLWGDTDYTCEACTEKLAEEPCQAPEHVLCNGPNSCRPCLAREVQA